MKKISVFFTAMLGMMSMSLYAEPGFPDGCFKPCNEASACGPRDQAADCLPVEPCDRAGCDLSDQTNCSPCDPCTLFKRNHGCARKSFWDSLEINGWIQGGVYANTRGNTIRRERIDNYKGRNVSAFVSGSGNGDVLVSNRSTDFQINQLWLNAYKEADGTHGLDWGFRAEYLFGTDSWFCQSWNDARFDYGWQDGDYYSSIPQLYFQLALGKFSVKLGKYETLLGGESMRAPDFFFYSHTYSYGLVEPYSHTGALVEWNPNDKWTLALGYTTGHDTSWENRFDDHGLIAQVAYQVTEKLNLSYVFSFSRYGDHPEYYPGGPARLFSGENVFFHTLCAGWQLTDRWFYQLQWDFSDAKVRGEDSHRIVYGLVNTLTYKICKHWSVGGRFEWMKDKNGEYVGAYAGDMYNYTLGLNWTPYSNLNVRPEIRYDYSPNDYVFNNGKNRDQVSGGVGAVVTF